MAKGTCPLEEHMKNGNYDFTVLLHNAEIQLLNVFVL